MLLQIVKKAKIVHGLFSVRKLKLYRAAASFSWNEKVMIQTKIWAFFVVVLLGGVGELGQFAPESMYQAPNSVSPLR